MIIRVISFSILFFVSACNASEEELLQRAHKNAENGNYDKAIGLNTKVIQLNDKNEMAYFNRGICYSNLDSNEKALADFDKILSFKSGRGVEITFNPQFATGDERYKISYLDALYQRALVKYNMDSLRSAFIDFKTCLDNDYELKGKCCLHIGDIYMRASDKKNKGCEYYRNALLFGMGEASDRLSKYCK
jgi:tetratricopeptide (TPR) repeat protein